jgi:DNA mismatch endonuclease (patch repair protein)
MPAVSFERLPPGRRDHLSVEQRSHAMSLVRRRDTRPEIALRRALWRAGVRGWRCDVSSLPGRPDVAFSNGRLAIFVDGRLWHGHPSKYPGRLTPYWLAKIDRNVARDRDNDQALAAAGWTVLRFWDHDVLGRSENCVRIVTDALSRSRSR